MGEEHQMDEKNKLCCSSNPRKLSGKVCNSENNLIYEKQKEVFMNLVIDQADDYATILIKKLIKIIHKNESIIVIHIRKIDESDCFNIKNMMMSFIILMEKLVEEILQGF